MLFVVPVLWKIQQHAYMFVVVYNIFRMTLRLLDLHARSPLDYVVRVWYCNFPWRLSRSLSLYTNDLSLIVAFTELSGQVRTHDSTHIQKGKRRAKAQCTVRMSKHTCEQGLSMLVCVDEEGSSEKGMQAKVAGLRSRYREYLCDFVCWSWSILRNLFLVLQSRVTTENR